MEKDNLTDNYDYVLFCKFLEEDKSEKAKELLKKLKSLNQKTFQEYAHYRAELEYKAFLMAF
jgi:hypothetical protein